MNKHLEVAGQELTKIRGYWEKFFGITEEEKKDSGPKVVGKPGEFASDEPLDTKTPEGFMKTFKEASEMDLETARMNRATFEKGLTVYVNLNGTEAAASTNSGQYNQ
jgi:hypothetical protein